jgi:predicted nucleic acid-binding protein
MIVVDTSVWIPYLAGVTTPGTQKLDALEHPTDILLGDLILLEILQGARSGRHAAALETQLRRFDMAPMLNPRIAIAAARNYRELRQLGITVRKTVDLIIGTFCIENGHHLLHRDRDFAHMAQHLGLMEY